MKAVLCKTHGPPESLVVEDLADPTPGPGEVVVDVAFASLNFFDTLIIENKYQLKPELPFSPGGELSGRVAAIGEGVEGFKVGDRVAANTGYGACRAKVVVKARRLVPVPDGLADEAAAGLMIAYGTSLYALKNRAELKSGETLAVLGAAGGAGLAAVEIGKALGARVIACASSAEKLDFARSRGAEMTLDYSTTDLKEGLRELTGGKGADVIYDPVGGDLAEAALRSIAWKGRYLVIGFAAGQIPKFPMNLALLKGCDIRGVFWGGFAEREPKAFAEHVRELFAWALDERIRVHTAKVFALEETGAAIRYLADRKAIGKVLVRP
jgi:NADPH2:quinone reductase